MYRKIPTIPTTQPATGNIAGSLFDKFDKMGLVGKSSSGLAGFASQASGVIGSVLNTAMSGVDMANTFNAESPNGYTPEGEAQMNKAKSKSGVNMAMSVANLVLSTLATLGTGGTAVPWLLGSLGTGIISGLNKRR